MVNTCAGAAMISLRQVQPLTPPSTGSGGGVHAAEAIPVPWQQCRQIGDLVIGDACEHVGEPSLRINIVELGRLNQCQHDRGALAAAIGAGEEPRLSPQRNSSERAFGGVVAQANPAVIEEAREGIDALEHVIHGLGDIVVAREFGALSLEPRDDAQHAASVIGPGFRSGL